MFALTAVSIQNLVPKLRGGGLIIDIYRNGSLLRITVYWLHVASKSVSVAILLTINGAFLCLVFEAANSINLLMYMSGQ